MASRIAATRRTVMLALWAVPALARAGAPRPDREAMAAAGVFAMTF